MAGDPSTVRKPLACRVGLHAYVQRHSEDERLRGPDDEVCRRCGRPLVRATTIVPPGAIG
ncbi:MAG TPA: hypothetical protein VER97_14830 [Geodermatophilus sp.]|nr:hypothetical protein [Geodermatophilus sp.]